MSWNDIKQNDNTKENNVNFLKIEDKQTVVIRVMSEEPHSTWRHWIASAKRSFTCLGKGCPVCEIIKQDKANNATARYNSSKRHALIVWNYTTKQIEVLEQGKDFFTDLLAFVEDPDLGDLRDYDLKITRKGTGTNTKYTIIPGVKKRVDEDAENAFKECNIDLQEYYKQPTQQQMIDVLQGKALDEVFKQDGDSNSETVDFTTE